MDASLFFCLLVFENQLPTHTIFDAKKLRYRELNPAFSGENRTSLPMDDIELVGIDVVGKLLSIQKRVFSSIRINNPIVSFKHHK